MKNILTERSFNLPSQCRSQWHHLQFRQRWSTSSSSSHCNHYKHIRWIGSPTSWWDVSNTSIYATVPLTLLRCQIPENSLKTIGSNLWKEDYDCLKWLDDKVHESVMYMNFGSGSILTNQQLVEFAWGLADSGHDLLWVIRPDIVNGDSTILLTEFFNEIDGRGFLTSWCPQGSWHIADGTLQWRV